MSRNEHPLVSDMQAEIDKCRHELFEERERSSHLHQNLAISQGESARLIELKDRAWDKVDELKTENAELKCVVESLVKNIVRCENAIDELIERTGNRRASSGPGDADGNNGDESPSAAERALGEDLAEAIGERFDSRFAEHCEELRKHDRRDRFAAAALQGLLACPDNSNLTFEHVVKTAVRYADEMLEATP